MKKDWIGNVFFAALVSAAYYVLQRAIEKAGAPAPSASALAALTSGLVVGIGLRFAVTTTPLRIGLVRRMWLPAYEAEGKWLEVLDRRGERHYSIVDFVFTPSGEADPYEMVGHSFFPTGKEHSEWRTRYLKVTPGPMLSVEYIYIVTQSLEDGRPPYGYGESWFTGASAKMLDRGKGYYFAAEEHPLYRCTYKLRRIDSSFRQLVGLDAKENLDDHPAMELFVRLVHDYYSSNPLQ